MGAAIPSRLDYPESRQSQMSQELLGAKSHNKALGASPENQKLQFREQTSIDAKSPMHSLTLD